MKLVNSILLVLLVSFSPLTAYAHQGFLHGPSDVGDVPGAVFAKMTREECNAFHERVLIRTQVITTKTENVLRANRLLLDGLEQPVSEVKSFPPQSNELQTSLTNMKQVFGEQQATWSLLRSDLANLATQPCDEYGVMNSLLSNARLRQNEIHDLDDKFINLYKQDFARALQNLLALYE